MAKKKNWKLKRVTVAGVYKDNDQSWLESFWITPASTPETILEVAFDAVLRNNNFEYIDGDTGKDNAHIRFTNIFEGEVKEIWNDGNTN